MPRHRGLRDVPRHRGQKKLPRHRGKKFSDNLIARIEARIRGGYYRCQITEIEALPGQSPGR